jgi:hypothetical protein
MQSGFVCVVLVQPKISYWIWMIRGMEAWEDFPNEINTVSRPYAIDTTIKMLYPVGATYLAIIGRLTSAGFFNGAFENHSFTRKLKTSVRTGISFQNPNLFEIAHSFGRICRVELSSLHFKVYSFLYFSIVHP